MPVIPTQFFSILFWFIECTRRIFPSQQLCVQHSLLILFSPKLFIRLVFPFRTLVSFFSDSQWHKAGWHTSLKYAYAFPSRRQLVVCCRSLLYNVPSYARSATFQSPPVSMLVYIFKSPKNTAYASIYEFSLISSTFLSLLFFHVQIFDVDAAIYIFV